MLEYALLDVAPDSAMDLNKKRRILRWDAKKRKFVKVSSLSSYTPISKLNSLTLFFVAITGGDGAAGCVEQTHSNGVRNSD